MPERRSLHLNLIGSLIINNNEQTPGFNDMQKGKLIKPYKNKQGTAKGARG